MVSDLQFVVAGGESPVLLEAVDEALDAVAFAVGLAVEAAVAPLALLAGDDGADPPLAQPAARRAAAVPLVAGHPIRAQLGPTAPRALDRAAVQQRRQCVLFVALPGGQDAGDRLAAPLGAEVDFGGEAAAGAAEGLLPAPFLAPAACWWARTVVPSTKCRLQSRSPAASPSACSAASTRPHTPARCQRRKREYTVCHGPYRSGKSRHGAPVVRCQRMALTTVRWSLAGRPVAGRCGGSNGRNRSHWASLSSCRRIIHQGYHAFANTA